MDAKLLLAIAGLFLLFGCERKPSPQKKVIDTYTTSSGYKVVVQHYKLLADDGSTCDVSEDEFIRAKLKIKKDGLFITECPNYWGWRASTENDAKAVTQ